MGGRTRRVRSSQATYPNEDNLILSIWYKRAATLLVALAVLLVASPLLAQEKAYSPNAAQVKLLQKGGKASKAGDHKAAVSHYQAVVDLGPFNAAHLLLGRALQKNGECKAAQESYKAALEAPQVVYPPHAQVKERIAQYTAELMEVCPGVLVLKCDPPEVVLTLDGAPLACNTPTTLSPGTYKVKATLGDVEDTREVTLTAMASLEVPITLERPDPPKEKDPITDPIVKKDPDPPVDPAPEGLSNQQILGWSLVGTGTASLIAGGVFTGLVARNTDEVAALAEEISVDPDRAQSLRDEGDRFTSLQFIGYGLGTALTATGLLLVVFDEAPEAPAKGLTWSPMLGGWGVQAILNY